MNKVNDLWLWLWLWLNEWILLLFSPENFYCTFVCAYLMILLVFVFCFKKGAAVGFVRCILVRFM